MSKNDFSANFKRKSITTIFQQQAKGVKAVIEEK
jgi:hypothetical protein